MKADYKRALGNDMYGYYHCLRYNKNERKKREKRKSPIY